jgi:hypothetical protein
MCSPVGYGSGNWVIDCAIGFLEASKKSGETISAGHPAGVSSDQGEEDLMDREIAINRQSL